MKRRFGGFWQLIVMGLVAHAVIITVAVEHW
jgi:hypothetical protein